jgi:hypothetical protein
MSFGIQVVGTVADIKREIEEMNFSDNEQAQAARVFILDELGKMPANDYQNGANVQAHGHYDSTFRNIRIEITQTHVALPKLPEVKVVEEFSAARAASEPAAAATAEAEVPASDSGTKRARRGAEKAGAVSEAASQ